jgi:hypothetical protein
MFLDECVGGGRSIESRLEAEGLTGAEDAGR